MPFFTVFVAARAEQVVISYCELIIRINLIILYRFCEVLFRIFDMTLCYNVFTINQEA